jgi:hypothetical protein
MIILIIVLSGCSSSEQLMLGDYYSTDFIDKISIKKDSTYEYTRKIGWHYNFSNGKWKIGLNDTLFLFSERTDRLFQIEVEEKTSLALKDSMCFFVSFILPDTLDSYIAQNSYLELFVNDKKVNSIREKVLFKALRKEDIKNISFHIQADLLRLPVQAQDKSLKTNAYQIVNPLSNLFLISISLEKELFNYKLFNREALVYKKNKIIWFRENRQFKRVVAGTNALQK